jgi:hypothetical protein
MKSMEKGIRIYLQDFEGKNGMLKFRDGDYDE